VHKGFDELAELPRLGMVRVILFSMDRMGHEPTGTIARTILGALDKRWRQVDFDTIAATFRDASD
jgi:hypothetical protein